MWVISSGVRSSLGAFYKKTACRHFAGFSRLRYFCIVCVFFSGLFFQLPEVARASDKALSTNAWPHEKTDLAPDPALKCGQLENGFRYVFLKNKNPKGRVSMHLNVQAGSMHEKDHEQGIAHFLEHMLFNGTTHFKPGELIKYFQSIGMQFGNDVNARTGFYTTVYDLLLPSGDEKELDKAFLVFNDYAQGASLLSEEIDSERKVILAEMRDRDTASYRTFLSTVKFEMPDTRLVHRMPIGKQEIIQDINQKMLKAFYDKWYAPDNIILVMVGDFESDVALKLIKKHFGTLNRRLPDGTSPSFGNFEHKGIKPFYHYENEAGKTTVSIEAVRKISPLNDSFDLQKQILVRKTAERMVQHRINDMLNEPDTPFSSAHIRSDYFYNQVFFSEISAYCNAENWQKSLFRMEQVLRQALEFGFTQSELDRVKKEILARLDNQSKNMSTRDSRRLARQIISSLADNRVYQSPLQRQNLFSPVISELTLQDVHDAMKRTWSAEHRLILVTGDIRLDNQQNTPEELIHKAYVQSGKMDVDPPEEIKTKAFPYLPASVDLPVVVNRTYRPDTDTVHIDFKNSVRLNLKKTDFKANEVLISATFGRGRSIEPKNLPGLSILTEGVINKSGLGKMPLDELRRALSGKRTSIAFHVNQEHFSFQLKTTPEEVDLAFELIKAHLIDPAFRQEAFELTREKLKQRYDAFLHTTQGAVELYAKSFLAGEDWRFGFPNQSQINKINLSDIEAWILPALTSSPLEVSVVGNFDKDGLISAARKSLGALSQRHEENKLLSHKKGPEFPSGKTRKIFVDTKIPQALIIVAYPTDDIWDIHQTRTLSLLAEIISEKVRVQIREKLGVAYSPHVFNQPSRVYKNYGKLLAIIKTDPDSVALVVEEVKKIAQNLAVIGVTQEDIKYALDPMLTGIKDMKRENRYWLKTVLTESKNHPQQLEWSQNILEDYRDISERELSEAAKTFLNNDKCAVFVAVPGL